MANKTDVRIIKTKQKLRASLTEILAKKTIDEITISEICLLAEVNRNTFYSHYSDVYSLYDDLKESYLEFFIKEIERMKADGENAQHLITFFLESIKGNGKLFTFLYKDYCGLEFISRIIEEALGDQIKSIKVQASLISEEDFYNYILGGAVNLVVKWLDGEGETDAKEMGAKICYFIYNIKSIYV